MKRWATWPVAALVLLVLVAVGAIGYAVNHERGVHSTSFTDAVKNQRILDRLKPYPGSRQTRKFVRRSYGGYGRGLVPGADVRSHSTTVVYSVPAGVKPRQVIAFYARQLGHWERQQEETGFPCGPRAPQGPCFASFTKGEASALIQFDRRQKTFSLVIDHQGASSGYYGGD